MVVVVVLASRVLCTWGFDLPGLVKQQAVFAVGRTSREGHHGGLPGCAQNAKIEGLVWICYLCSALFSAFDSMSSPLPCWASQLQ